MLLFTQFYWWMKLDNLHYSNPEVYKCIDDGEMSLLQNFITVSEAEILKDITNL